MASLVRFRGKQGLSKATAHSIRGIKTWSRLLQHEVEPITRPAEKYRVAIVGGGAAGVSVASQLLRKLPRGEAQIAVIEPSDHHFYKPMWTMVGGLGLDVKNSARPMGQVMPLGVDWVKDACESFEPDTNSLVLTGSKRLKYDILVVCVGIQQNFDQIPGLEETIGKNGVCSIYSYKYSPIVWESIQNLKKGTAIFTNPKTAVSCGGAPQKIAYLADCEWRRQGVRGQIDLHFHTATPGIFGCPSYRVELEKLMAEKHIHPHVQSNLVAVDGHSQTATFELEGGERVQRKFDLLHVTPPMSPPAFVKKSPLANAAGFIDVDKYTCQHVRYPNVFALGDSSSLPTSKTYSAVSAESPVVVHNIKSMLEDPSATFASYDGYTACPILLGGKKLMLAEFNGYTNDPVSTFWPLNQRKGSHLFFLMKRFVFEQVYWHFMPVGRWFGKHTIFHPKLRLKSSSEGNR